VLKTVSQHVAVETLDGELVVLTEYLFNGSLIEKMARLHPCICLICLSLETALTLVELVHFVNESLVALFSFKFVKRCCFRDFLCK